MLKTLFLMIPLFLVSCFPYVYHEQDRVLIENIDIDATLEIARIELEEGGFDETLTIWAIRDQTITVEQAEKVSKLYFDHIDRIAAGTDRTVAGFGVWHFGWAVSNLYRNADESIRAELERAYLDARKRPDTLDEFKDVAAEHINGDKIYMGDIHAIARSYALSHIVAPGNGRYVQSLGEYKELREKKMR